MKELRRLLFIIGGGLAFLFVIFLVNQTVQVVHLCYSLHPVFGTVMKYLLLAIYAGLIVATLYYFSVLPRPLQVPADKDSENYRLFLLSLTDRLRRNKHLAQETRDTLPPLKDPEPNLETLEKAIEEAEKELDKKADKEVRTTAQAIFISTAVSQSGALDSIVVLVGQVKMIWRLARIYHQRPSLREITKLYGNVAASSIAARAVDDLDFAEIIEPVIRNFGSVGVLNLIPIISIVSNSLFCGTTNALLTLRTGIITRKYCSLFSHFEAKQTYKDEKELKRHIKTSAIKESGKVLGSVVITPSQTVINMVLGGLKKSKDFSGKVINDVGKASKDVFGRIVDFFKPGEKDADIPD